MQFYVYIIFIHFIQSGLHCISNMHSRMLIQERRGSDEWKYLFALPLNVAAGKNISLMYHLCIMGFHNNGKNNGNIMSSHLRKN